MVWSFYFPFRFLTVPNGQSKIALYMYFTHLLFCNRPPPQPSPVAAAMLRGQIRVRKGRMAVSLLFSHMVLRSK